MDDKLSKIRSVEFTENPDGSINTMDFLRGGLDTTFAVTPYERAIDICNECLDIATLGEIE
jgi:hypothetical protein